MSKFKNRITHLRKRIYHLFYKNKKYKTEDEFYTHLFTKNPSWSSPEGNEDETQRWEEIKSEIEKAGGKDLSILEIGCGRGWLCNKLQAYGNVTGIDPVEPVINYAKKLFPSVEFHADLLPSFIAKFPGKKYDLVVSTEVIEHVNNKEEFAQNIHSLLTANGMLILTTPRLEHYNDFTKAYGIDPGQPVEEWVSEPQLRTLFEGNGFTVQAVKFFSPLPNTAPPVYITQLWVCRKKS